MTRIMFVSYGETKKIDRDSSVQDQEWVAGAEDLAGARDPDFR